MASVQMAPRSHSPSPGPGPSNAEPGPHPHLVAVVPMHPLKHAMQPDDDWTGLKDRAERKKRQTRLNVRAHRRRKAAEQQQQQQQQQKRQDPVSHQIHTPAAALETPTCHAPPNLGSIFTGPVHPFPLLPLSQAYYNLSQHLFPLSSDHLIPLIEYNVYRATLTNIYIMSLFQLLQSPCCAYLLNPPPPLFPGPETTCPSKNTPASLQFTEMQRNTPHEMWIDTFPSPRMRDNAIVAVQQGRLNNDQVCRDLLRGLCGGAKAGRRLQPLQNWGGDDDDEVDARMIVWTTPWEAGGWEVTEGFARKYGFLLKGCEDLLMSTNRYRRQRGDEDLVWEVD